MNILFPTPPTVTPPASSVAPEQKPRHFFYLLHFEKYPDAFKVGISDPVDLRIRQLSSAYGSLDLSRCVTVAVTSRREAEVMERTVLMLHEESRHDWGRLGPDALGHTEWLRTTSRPEVIATVADWVRRRAAHCRLVPIAEVAGDAVNCGGKDSVANRIRKAEKHQGALARRRAKEAARQEANRDQLRPLPPRCGATPGIPAPGANMGGLASAAPRTPALSRRGAGRCAGPWLRPGEAGRPAGCPP